MVFNDILGNPVLKGHAVAFAKKGKGLTEVDMQVYVVKDITVISQGTVGGARFDITLIGRDRNGDPYKFTRTCAKNKLFCVIGDAQHPQWLRDMIEAVAQGKL